MSFKEKDRVKVVAENHSKFGDLGVVNHVYEDGGCLVQLDSGNRSAFFEDELTILDPKREALIELAETLDKARLQANAIAVTAPQGNVYGMAANALVSVLAYITDAYEAQRIYERILDGNTVREALKAVEK